MKMFQVQVLRAYYEGNWVLFKRSKKVVLF